MTACLVFYQRQWFLFIKFMLPITFFVFRWQWPKLPFCQAMKFQVITQSINRSTDWGNWYTIKDILYCNKKWYKKILPRMWTKENCRRIRTQYCYIYNHNLANGPIMDTLNRMKQLRQNICYFLEKIKWNNGIKY